MPRDEQPKQPSRTSARRSRRGRAGILTGARCRIGPVDRRGQGRHAAAVPDAGRAERGARNLSQLAQALDVAPSTAMRMIDRLEAAGLVSRAVPAANRRETRLELTAAGSRAVRTVTARRRRDLRAVIERIPPEQRATWPRPWPLSRRRRTNSGELRSPVLPEPAIGFPARVLHLRAWASARVTPALPAERHEYDGYADLLEDYFAKGWTDGLPSCRPPRRWSRISWRRAARAATRPRRGAHP